MSGSGAPPVVLDGSSLTLDELVRVARDPRVPVACAPEALERVAAGRAQIESIAHAYRRDFERYEAGEVEEPPVQDYGVTTGFGEFKDIPVSPGDLERLQRNILLSHSVGVGESSDAEDPAGYLPAEVVRATLLIRLNAFLKGHSGVRPELVAVVEAMLRRGIVPRVPIRGSVGSSGDLCPLAHLFAVLVGQGRYHRVEAPEDLAPRPRELREAREHLAADLGMEVPEPSYKEGLALVNGATVSAALLALAVADAEAAANAADAAAALTLEAACGCARALDPKVHAARRQAGQEASAANLRALVAGSRLVDSAGAVQDPYSLRAAPPVHGASRDAIAYARMVAERELNAATDNPLFFPGDGEEPAWDGAFRDNWPPGYRGDARASYSAANFHGQPLAIAADVLAVALAELADISERRAQLLLDRHHNRNLPPGLVADRGVNTGLMIAQYTAAGLVSENKVLAHPASVDSIPTSANSEDHNSMATIAGRKARTVLGNALSVLAVELLVAAQAVEWRVAMERTPHRPDGRWPKGRAAGAALSAAQAGDLRAQVEREGEEFAARTAPGRRQEIAARLGRGTGALYLAVRERVEPVVADRPLDADLRRLRRSIEDRSLLAAVEDALGHPLRPVPPLAGP